MTKARQFQLAVGKNKRKPFLTAYSCKELRTFRLYLCRDQSAGFAVKPDGELVNLFNNGTRAKCRHLAREAIRLGARTLACFDGFLRAYYERLGFHEYARVRWDDRYAPRGWDYTTFGRPDVVYMRLK